ncbi:hypothetical protein ACFFJ7_06650 [Pseudochelatococcus lubricantis]|uniref:hypothetical protein n=1 Tax=Pseudochelatococcus lubricantis TaxID=1538102 RepID=UPI0035EAAF16
MARARVSHLPERERAVVVSLMLLGQQLEGAEPPAPPPVAATARLLGDGEIVQLANLFVEAGFGQDGMVDLPFDALPQGIAATLPDGPSPTVKILKRLRALNNPAIVADDGTALAAVLRSAYQIIASGIVTSRAPAATIWTFLEKVEAGPRWSA